MSYLLNVFYICLLLVISPWLLYSAIRKGKYREGWTAKLFGRVPLRQRDKPCIWLHAVSVGEVNQLASLLQRIAQQWPECECVISTTTKTGFDLANTKYSGHTVFYCPLDFSWAVKQAVNRIRPKLLILTELELWPNLIRFAKRHGARVAVINGRLSEKSFHGYRRIRWVVEPLLKSIDLFAVQTDEYAARFRCLGARGDAVHVTGSLKFDGVQTGRNNIGTQAFVQLAGIKPADVVFLAGSTQAPEEEIALATFRQLSCAHPNLRLILVPRHPERFDEVAGLLCRSGLPWQRRSALNQNPADPHARVLLVDTIGELGAWWGTAQIAFVGGSLGKRGGQNMIEPAAYGAAISVGPNTQNFRDIVALLLSKEAAVVVHNANELTGFVERCLQDTNFAREMGRRAQRLVIQQIGATERTVQLLANCLPHPHLGASDAA